MRFPGKSIIYMYATELFLDIYKVYPILKNIKLIYNSGMTVDSANSVLTDPTVFF